MILHQGSHHVSICKIAVETLFPKTFNANNQGRLDSKVIYGSNFGLDLGNRNDDEVKLFFPCYTFCKNGFLLRLTEYVHA